MTTTVLKNFNRIILIFTVIVLSTSALKIKEAKRYSERDTFYYMVGYYSEDSFGRNTVRYSGLFAIYRYDSKIDQKVSDIEEQFEAYMIEEFKRWNDSGSISKESIQDIKENTMITWFYRKTRKSTLRSFEKYLKQKQKKFNYRYTFESGFNYKENV